MTNSPNRVHNPRVHHNFVYIFHNIFLRESCLVSLDRGASADHFGHQFDHRNTTPSGGIGTQESPTALTGLSMAKSILIS